MYIYLFLGFRKILIIMKAKPHKIRRFIISSRDLSKFIMKRTRKRRIKAATKYGKLEFLIL